MAFDINKALSEIGVSEKDIKHVTNNIQGEDLVNLVLCLNKSSIEKSYRDAWNILEKYGVKSQTKEFVVNANQTNRLIEWLGLNGVNYTIANNELKIHDIDESQIEQLIGDIMNEAKTAKQAKADLDKHLDKTPRNPFALGAKLRPGAGAHDDGKRKNDQYDRKAKHKNRSFDEEIEYTVGEQVTFEDKEATIKIPNGPNGTIGILVDNKLRMVGSAQISKLNEGILGVTTMDSLGRLRELAGIKNSTNASSGNIKETIDRAFEDYGLGLDYGLGEEDDDDLGVDIGDDVSDTMGGVDTVSVAPSTPTVSPMGAPSTAPIVTPPSIPNTPTIDPVTAPVASQAYSQILDHLNNIQNCLSDIRLSEYRSLIQKLDDLSTQVRNMGRDYLGE